jgi:hypothetical protein
MAGRVSQIHWIDLVSPLVRREPRLEEVWRCLAIRSGLVRIIHASWSPWSGAGSVWPGFQWYAVTRQIDPYPP